jgi:hypothetical protein
MSHSDFDEFSDGVFLQLQLGDDGPVSLIPRHGSGEKYFFCDFVRTKCGTREGTSPSECQLSVPLLAVRSTIGYIKTCK